MSGLARSSLERFNDQQRSR